MNSDIQRQYKKHVRKRLLFGMVLLVLLLVASFWGLRIGSYPVGDVDLMRAICGEGDAILRHVVWNIRLPRLAAALLAGACLGLAGAAMQTVLSNPLASPFTVGISQGAAFGAAFAIIVIGAGELTIEENGSLPVSPHVIALCAFGGSLLTVVTLLILASARDLSPEALILTGVALSSFFGAATMLLQYFASDIQVAAAVFWTFGDLGKARWKEIMLILLAALPALFTFALKRWDFNALLWGDDTARSLGTNVSALRLVSLLMAALVSSVSTAFLGIIGFVGLIAPHIMRMIVGEDHRFLFPYAALSGAVLLIVSDALARLVVAPVVLPVGILTSFAGVPLFLYLVVKHRGLR